MERIKKEPRILVRKYSLCCLKNQLKVREGFSCKLSWLVDCNVHHYNITKDNSQSNFKNIGLEVEPADWLILVIGPVATPYCNNVVVEKSKKQEAI